MHFCNSLSRVWLLLAMLLCASKAPAQDAPAAEVPAQGVSAQGREEAFPAPLFTERTEDQVERMLANAPPGEHDGSQAGLKVFVAERFSAGHQLAFLIASCACLCLLVPGAFLIVNFFQGIALKPERTVQVVATLGVLSLAWIMFIYSLAFSRNAHSYDVLQREVQVMDRATAPGTRFIGDLNHMTMKGLLSEWGGGLVRHPVRRSGDSIPHSLFMVFQMAIFLQALVPLLAVVNSRLSGWSTFVLLLTWSVFVYAPLCYWTRGGGWLADCVDVGGTVPMHIAVGFTALGLCRFGISKSVESKLDKIRDDSVASQTNHWVLLVGAILYLGGSLLVAGCRSVSSAPWPTFDFVNLFMGSVTGLLMWLLVAQRSHAVMTIGWPLGMIAGIVSVTSGCASVTPTSTVVVSAIGTLACCMAVMVGGSVGGARVNVYWLLFAVFGVSGVIGMALTGVFASPEIAGADIASKPIVGVIAGNYELLRLQLLTAAVAATLAGIAGLVLPYVAIVVGAVLQWIFSGERSGKSVLNSEIRASV